MPTLRHRVLNASSQPVAGYTATARPYSGNKYAPRPVGGVTLSATTGADGWLNFTLPQDVTGQRRTFWRIQGPGLDLVAIVPKDVSTATTGSGTTLGTLAADQDLVPDMSVPAEEAALPVRLSDTALKATFVPAASRGQTIALLGDSITDQNFQTTPPAYQTNGFWTWAAIILRQRLTLAGVFGYAGQRISVVASHVPDVLAVNPGTVVVVAGTNDVPTNATLAQMQADMTDLLTALRAGGVRIVIGTLPPRASYTGSQQAVLFGYNRWLAVYGASIGATVVDWASVLTDPATGVYAAGMSPDGVHPDPLGAARMGARLAAALGPITPATDAQSAGGDPTNLLPNGAMTGGPVATNWFVKDLAGGTNNPATVTPTKVARTDDVPGEWQQLVVATTPGASLWSPGAVGYAAGDQLYATCEFERGNDWAAMGTANRTLRLTLRTQPTVANSYGLNHPSGRAFPLAAMPMSGVLRTAPVTVPAGTTKVDLAIEFSGTGTLRIGRVEIRKVGT